MKPSVWIAVALMFIGAIMLVADLGAPALWIAAVTVGIALAVIGLHRGRSPSS
jgi:membrane-bound ClpP family serine protease